jgi:phospholipid/cholesterol/gamma-HCH transport system permease protein
LDRQPGRVSLVGDSTVRFQGFLDRSLEETVEDFFDSRWKSLSVNRNVAMDFGDCDGFDSVAAVLIFRYISRLESSGVRIGFTGLSDDDRELFDSFRQNQSRTGKKKKRYGLREHFEDVGEHVLEFIYTVRGLADFALDTLAAFIRTVARPASVRWPMVFYYMEQTGVKAIPIITVLCWLLGTILGYQAGYQMKNFGAELYMPSLLAYSITWEIGPMLAAVLVAGRSGSAFAAEIGTMRVRQEVDALSVMGFNVFSYLVTPKMIALMFVMPILVLLANFSGLVGGLLAGGIFLNMPASIYMAELSKALIPMDVYWGMLKGILYAALISTTGCYMGMRVRGGAAAVGRATTSAVVASIFLVIVCDALLSILFVHIRPGLTI